MYANKEKREILRAALQKLQSTTPITAIGPGSVARSLAEAVTNELGDFYAAMDYNTSMGLVSTATGRALDLIAQLYGVERKKLTNLATIDESVGAFYFYLEQPHTSQIQIPQGTFVYTNVENFIGDQYTYVTTADVTIPAGRTRVYAPIRPNFADSVFTAGKHTITEHNVNIENVDLFCTNPKAISPQLGYESDENLRLRLKKAVRTSAGGTIEAVRFSGLAVHGVRDVKIRSAPYGLGSLEALVVTEARDNAVEVVSQVIDALEETRPAGVRLFVREPDYTRCNLRATIIIRKDLDVDENGTAQRAVNGVLRYLNRLMPGEKLVYTQLVQSILDASDAIADVNISRLQLNDVDVLRSNYQPEEDHQIIPGELRILPA